MVTICTASLTFNNSTFSPHSVFMCFVWIWEQTAIISLYSIKGRFCITYTESVYCAVRTGSLYIIQLNQTLKFFPGFQIDTSCLSFRLRSLNLVKFIPLKLKVIKLICKLWLYNQLEIKIPRNSIQALTVIHIYFSFIFIPYLPEGREG